MGTSRNSRAGVYGRLRCLRFGASCILPVNTPEHCEEKTSRMVFESLVVDLMNRFLGDYVENLDRSQLKLGIWGGDAVLQNLDLKESALDELDLPVRIKVGHIAKLTLKIPWKNLYEEPVVAELDGVYAL